MSDTSKEHKKTALKRLNFALFTVSTSRFHQKLNGQAVKDETGDLIQSLVEQAGQSVSARELISDDKRMIERSIRAEVKKPEVDIVVFCGGSGVTSSDVTVESVIPFFEKVLPGFGEFFRRLSFDQIGSAAVLSRATAGIAKGKVIFCIPGSPDAARLCFERLILPEAGHIVRHARE